MAKHVLLFVNAAFIAVAHCRVTFSHSEVLQQTDLDATNTAKFNCVNGCYIYSRSQNPEMYINDGTNDVSNFLVMGEPDKGTKTELVKGKDYKLVWKGGDAPPSFVFYAVDKLAPYTDTPVHAVIGDEAGFLVDPSQSRRFTLLRSVYPAPPIAFEGDFEDGYPKIYATGYDALIENECKPVYEARSQSSMLNSWLTIASPILTVDKGRPIATTAIKTSDAFTKKLSDSSIVYKSPGYVGCSIDFSGYLNVPTENEAVKITVNDEPINLYGTGTMLPISKQFDGDGFNITISWARSFTTSSSFAIQFDLGVFDTVAMTPKAEVTTRETEEITGIVEVTTPSVKLTTANAQLTTTETDVTTSSGARATFLASALILFLAL